MSIEAAIQELDEICKFLNGHENITHVTYQLTHKNMTIIIETDKLLPGLNIWLEQIETRLEAIFNRPVTYQIKTGTVENKNSTIQENNTKKLINSTTYIFSSLDSKFRLLRQQTEKKQFESEETYYQANKEISEQEVNSINQLLQIAVQDYKDGKFVKNFIEININNARSSDIMEKFAFIFRQIPKHFSDRFALSFVRISMNDSIDFTNKAISSFKQIIPQVYVSMELDAYIANQSKINEFACDGYLITAGNPHRKDIAAILKKADFRQISKEMYMIFYTRDWKEIPTKSNEIVPMFLKSRLDG